jgi:hypothetical protein
MFWFSKLSAERRRTIGHWLMELAIVVLGVVIALWLQQLGERRQAHRDMAAAEEAIHEEVRANLINLLWREAIGKCHLERVQKLKSMLLETGSRWPGLTENALLRNSISEATGVQSVVPGVYQRPGDSFTSSAWNSALARGALMPMDRDRFGLMVRLYDQIQLLSEARAREDRAAATLSALTLPQELTSDTRTRMLQALYELDASRFFFILAARDNLAAGMMELGWNDKAEIDHWIREDQAIDQREGVLWRPCVARVRNPFARPVARD